MRPFESIAGTGFKNLIQVALDIGVVSSGHFFVDLLLPTPVTLCRCVEKQVVHGRRILTGLLREHLASGAGVACTLDLWTDSVKKASYMSIVTAHYITEAFKLFARTLHVKPVHDASHTAIMVKNEFKEGLALYGITEDDYNKIIVISDDGSNCCGANEIPSEFEWLACLDHRIATV